MKCIICLSFFILFVSCNKTSEPNIKKLFETYMTASINHDVKTMATMTHDSIVWKLGPYTLKGKKAALGPNDYDEGTGTILEYTNVNIRGDTVEFELLERNAIITALGMKEIKHYPRFIFKNGLVYKKEAWKVSSDMQELSRRNKPRREWIQENHPEAVQKFFDSEGNFIFNKANGELQIKLTREWLEAQNQ
jgi:hypothetical protein